jgi:hypothetical protein
MNVVDTAFQSPELLAALTLVITAVWYWQRQLTLTEYRAWHRLKATWFTRLDGIASRLGRPLVHGKGGRGHPEFIAGVHTPPAEVARDLLQYGFEPHLLATLKTRDGEHGPQPTWGQFVYTEQVKGKTIQTEAYIFRNVGGSTDVFGHVETSVLDPVGHLTDPQDDGDGRGHIKSALRVPA